MSAIDVITNIDLFRHIQSFRKGFCNREHRALKKIKPVFRRWRSRRLWAKIKFWFNDDVRLVIPAISISS